MNSMTKMNEHIRVCGLHICEHLFLGIKSPLNDDEYQMNDFYNNKFAALRIITDRPSCWLACKCKVGLPTERKTCLSVAKLNGILRKLGLLKKEIMFIMS